MLLLVPFTCTFFKRSGVCVHVRPPAAKGWRQASPWAGPTAPTPGILWAQQTAPRSQVHDLCIRSPPTHVSRKVHTSHDRCLSHTRQPCLTTEGRSVRWWALTRRQQQRLAHKTCTTPTVQRVLFQQSRLMTAGPAHGQGRQWPAPIGLCPWPLPVTSKGRLKGGG